MHALRVPHFQLVALQFRGQQVAWPCSLHTLDKLGTNGTESAVLLAPAQSRCTTYMQLHGQVGEMTLRTGTTCMYRMPVLSKQPRREEVWQSVPAVGARTENNTHPYVPIENFATGRDPAISGVSRRAIKIMLFAQRITNSLINSFNISRSAPPVPSRIRRHGAVPPAASDVHARASRTFPMLCWR